MSFGLHNDGFGEHFTIWTINATIFTTCLRCKFSAFQSPKFDDLALQIVECSYVLLISVLQALSNLLDNS